MRWIKVTFWVAVIVTCIVLLVPADTVLAAKVWVASWLPMAAALDAADVTEHADKLVHASMFAILGALGIRGWLQADQHWRVLAFLLGLGVVTEALQSLVPGRSASIWDWLADAIGVLLGFGFGTRVVRQYFGMTVVSKGV
jgi:VanZ family protein